MYKYIMIGYKAIPEYTLFCLLHAGTSQGNVGISLNLLRGSVKETAKWELTLAVIVHVHTYRYLQ